MANQETIVAEAINNTVTVWVRYDDVSLDANRVRWANTGTRRCEATVTRDTSTWTTVIEPGTSGQRALAKGQLALVPVVDTDSGEVTYAWNASIRLRSL